MTLPRSEAPDPHGAGVTREVEIVAAVEAAKAAADAHTSCRLLLLQQLPCTFNPGFIGVVPFNDSLWLQRDTVGRQT